jgi:hypothetical protein
VLVLALLGGSATLVIRGTSAGWPPQRAPRWARLRPKAGTLTVEAIQAGGSADSEAESSIVDHE